MLRRALLLMSMSVLAGTGSMEAAQERAPDSPVVQGLRRPRFADINGKLLVPQNPQLEDPVEIRLLGSSGLVEDYTYTFGSGAFRFESVPTDGLYYIAIDVEGFEPVRERVDGAVIAMGSDLTFLLRPVATVVVEDDRQTELAVDVRRLQAEIPDEARRLYEQSRQAAEADEDPRALELLEAAVELAPEYFEALNNLGGQYVRLERYSDAEQVLMRAHELDPNSPTPLVNLGSAYSMEGDSSTRAGEAEAAQDSYVKAVQVLAQATLLDPTSASTSEYLGMALYRTGSFGASELLLLRALELDPELHDARLSLVNVYTRLGNLESAVEHAELFFELHPDSPQTAALENILEEIDRARNADLP